MNARKQVKRRRSRTWPLPGRTRKRRRPKQAQPGRAAGRPSSGYRFGRRPGVRQDGPGRTQTGGAAPMAGENHRLELAAAEAGIRAAILDGAQGAAEPERMQQGFQSWYLDHAPAGLSYREILPIALAFRKGYADASGLADPWIPLPLKEGAAAIVTASNEERTLPAVLAELCKLPFKEIIVVLNGCSDGSFAAVERDPRVTKLNFPERLGHDIGRAIGAAAASEPILLFTDGDMVLPAEELAAFLIAVDQGMDLALNNLSPYLPPFPQQDEVTRCKTFLNHALGRPDLQANSLTAVPHAISRRTLQTVGTGALIVPPKAQALALARGLTVGAPHSVDVVRKNRIRRGNTGAGNAVAQMIIGDHIEALGAVMQTEGVRLRHTTLPRSELAKARNAL
ncbi:glycosyltransferase family A protein [Paenibacillus macerans]|uniref:glycosyltransferase n=1 Tax=Paenibacillus macerans TaxID=44252 RepID=UPI003D2AC622